MSLLSGLILTRVLAPSLTGCLSVWLWAEIHFDDLKGKPFFPLFKYFRAWFSLGDSNTPFSRQQWPCPDVGNQSLESTETFILDYFYFKEILPLFPLITVLMQLCANFSINNSLIEINSVWTLWSPVKDLWQYMLRILHYGTWSQTGGEQKDIWFYVFFKSSSC